MIVKICGITRPDDALLAASLGATHIGLVFWPASPRAVTQAAAARIAAALPAHVSVVGVFVDATSDLMNDTADSVGLDMLQLHGDEREEIARTLTRPLIKAIPLRAAVRGERRSLRDGAPEAIAAVEGWPGVPLLLDAHDPTRRGGTGTVIDWDRAAQLARQRAIILAGGLTPENIGEAIGCVRPAGVDVSSGVEARPGIKDESRLRALFDAIAGCGGLAT